MMMLLIAYICAGSFMGVIEPQEVAREDPHTLAPTVEADEIARRCEAAQARGFAFLVAHQNVDGSWGSHDPKIANLADFGFQLRNRGSQDGVRLACTAICAQALLRKPDRSTAEQAALDRAVEAVLRTDTLAYHRGESFNTWGYGYVLDFLVEYLAHADASQRGRVTAVAERCIQGLRRFQHADGGWNYYGQPALGGASMSFNTAVFSLALHRAGQAGLEVPAGMVGDASKLLKRMQTIKGGFVYDARFLHDPRMVNELSAGGRTAVCTLALHDTGAATRDDLLSAVAVFDEGENYFEDGRKLIVPHSAVHQISGYFFFFGYNYVTELAERLGTDVSAERWQRFAWTMVRTQETDGSWWDTPAGHYGDKWGTGFALQVLQRCAPHVKKESGAQ